MTGMERAPLEAPWGAGELQRWFARLLAFLNKTFSGTATFPGATTVVVSFPGKPQRDTLYQIIVTPNANQTIWVTAKTTTSFTLNSSQAGSTASVDWLLTR